jgi:predicted RND superfamily exporter protein
MQEMIEPVVRTSLTTSIGFLSFALAPIEPVRMFGLFATLGILFCMAWSLLATPALLAILPVRWMCRRHAPKAVAPVPGAAHTNTALPGFRWIHWLRRNRRVVLTVALLLAILAVGGIRRLEVQDSWIDGFDPQSAFHRATQKFNAGFYGPHILQIGIDTGHATIRGIVNAADVHDNVYRLQASLERQPVELHGAILRVQHVDSTRVAQWDRVGNSNPIWTAILDSVVVYGDSLAFFAPRQAGTAQFLLRLQGNEDLRVEVETRRFDTYETLQQLGALGDFIRSQTRYAVGGVLGPADYIATAFFILHGRDPSKRIIPAESKQIAAQWLHFGTVRGEHHVHRVISDDHSRGVLSVYLKNANYQDTQALLRAIRNYEAQHLTPIGIHLSFGGDVAVSQSLIGAIVETQIRSLLFSLIGILLVSILLTRSWRLGTLTILPCSFAIHLNFGFMGWSGKPLGEET